LCEDFAILLIEGADGARRIDSLGHLRARIGQSHANLRLIAPAIARGLFFGWSGILTANCKGTEKENEQR
jgi:hypothetical protein